MGTIFKEAGREDTHLPFLISHYLSFFYIFPLEFSHSYKKVRKYPDETNERECGYFRFCCLLLTAQIFGSFFTLSNQLRFFPHSPQTLLYFILTPLQKIQCPVLKETKERVDVAVSLTSPRCKSISLRHTSLYRLYFRE
jgi:hypothetical protein